MQGTAVASYGVIAKSIFNGISQGTQPLISESYGNGMQQQAKFLLKSGMGISILAETSIISCIWAVTDPLIGIFNSERNELLLQYAHSGLRLYFLGFIFAGINIMLITYFSATDMAIPAMIGSVLRGAAAIILCAVVLARLFGMTGVWLSFLASELITFIVILPIYRQRRPTVKATYEK